MKPVLLNRFAIPIVNPDNDVVDCTGTLIARVSLNCYYCVQNLHIFYTVPKKCSKQIGYVAARVREVHE